MSKLKTKQIPLERLGKFNICQLNGNGGIYLSAIIRSEDKRFIVDTGEGWIFDDKNDTVYRLGTQSREKIDLLCMEEYKYSNS